MHLDVSRGIFSHVPNVFVQRFTRVVFYKYMSMYIGLCIFQIFSIGGNIRKIY